jgi:protein PsiE
MSEQDDKPEPPQMGPVTMADKSDRIATASFTVVEKALLVLTAVMTLVAAMIKVGIVIEARDITLADILLMFLYTEVIAMIAVFYTGKGSPFIYPILIAMTAIARLIVLQGKDMDPQNILFEAGAILLLAIAALVMLRVGAYGRNGNEQD